MAGAQITGGISEAYELLTAAIDEYKLQFPDQFRKDDRSANEDGVSK
jgi:predicted Zn-dependent protease